MAQAWWPRTGDYAACSTTREADSTAATGLRDIGISSRAPRPCGRFISTSTTTGRSSASPNPPLLADYTKGGRPTTRRRGVPVLYLLIVGPSRLGF